MLSTQWPDASPARRRPLRPRSGPGRAALRGLACALALATTSCARTAPVRDAEAERDVTCGSGGVEAGGSAGRFLPLPRSGGELPIVRGAQGGIHVLVGFRVLAVPLTLTATYRLRDPGTGETVGAPTVRALGPGLYRVDGVGTARVDDLLVLDPDTPRVEDFAGRVVALELEVVTAAGACARDTRTVTLQ